MAESELTSWLISYMDGRKEGRNDEPRNKERWKRGRGELWEEGLTEPLTSSRINHAGWKN